MNHAANDWSSVPDPPNFPGLGTWPPFATLSNYATALQAFLVTVSLNLMLRFVDERMVTQDTLRKA